MRIILLALCAVSFALTCAIALDEFGAGTTPWFGWWDANFVSTQPYVLVIHPRSGGAAMRSGLHDGDRIDLREQNTQGRIALLYQLMGTQPTLLMVHHGASARTVSVTGSSVWDNATFWKLQPMVSRLAANVVFTICALLLALRKSASRKANTVAAVFLCAVGIMLDPSFFVVPSPVIAIACFIISRVCASAAALLLIKLAAHYGTPSRIRSALALIATIVVISAFASDIACATGLPTARIDPIPFVLSLSARRSNLDVLTWLLVTTVAIAAVAAGPSAQRAKAAAITLALPAGFLISAICFATPTFIHSWIANVAVPGIANTALPIAALIATFAPRPLAGSS